MRLVRTAVGWALSVSLLATVLFAPTAARGTSEQPQIRDAARLVVHGVGTGVTYAGYRTSFQAPRAAPRPVTAPRSAHPAPRSPSSSVPTSVQGFLGIPQIEGFEPADPTGAMGERFFLTAVNTRFALWNLDGTEAMPPTLLTTLTDADNGLDIFDPKIVYDQYRDTFVMVYLAQRDSPPASEIVVTSIPDATADQPSTWCTRGFEGDLVSSDAAQWADYPGLGYTRDRVVITTNQFTFPTRTARFSYAQVASIPKSRLYDCNAELAGDVFAGTDTSNEDGSPAFAIQPAQTVGVGTDDQFLMSFDHRRGRGSSVTAWRLRRTSRGPTLRRTTIRAGRPMGGVVGTQAGGSLSNPDTFWDTGDLRLVTAWYDADRNQLYAAHNVAKDLVPDAVTGGYVESAIRWYEVDPAGTLSSSTLVRRGTIGDPETDAGWPSVATDGAGNLFVTYNRASEPLGEFISAWAAEISPGSTTAMVTELVAGTDFHDSIPGIERWGDFTAIGRDPLDPNTIVMVNQVATPGSAWQQTVNLVTHG
jgi:hypothetical protein